MANTWKQRWSDFKRGEPGRRFLARYERKNSSPSKRSASARLSKSVAAGVLLASGIVFCVIPGPGLPLVAFAACLLAEASRTVAAAMDRLELKVRSLLAQARVV